jgi:hypothetical protein
MRNKEYIVLSPPPPSEQMAAKKATIKSLFHDTNFASPITYQTPQFHCKMMEPVLYDAGIKTGAMFQSTGRKIASIR